GLMMVSLGISANDFDMEELPMELMVGGNTLITEFGGNQTRQDGRVIEVDSAGSIVWEKAGLNMPMDAERLSNGNTLITIYGDQLVIEVDSAGSIVWQKNNLTEPMDAERLSNGNTLIAEFGGDRVIEVDSAGSIVWEKAGLSSPFDVERFSNGNTLIVEANVVDGRVIEVDSAGSIVWEKTGLTGPIDAERLSNGNTLITEHIGKKIIEVDSAGNEVWNMTELHVPKSAKRLSDGNTLIAECGANRVIEVDSTGTIKWIKDGLHYPVDAERLSNPPDAPEITGKTNGIKGTEYEYSFTSTDPDGDDIEAYIVNWDDDGDETITGPFASGATAKASHTWDEAGTYIISATAIDVNGAQSDPGTLEVTIPRNKAFNFNFNLLERLFERFPNMFPVLRYLLGL
ncbi:PQQ-like domain-containing protein, partial [Thermoplasmatales archaeon SCGC AB-540-F20]